MFQILQIQQDKNELERQIREVRSNAEAVEKKLNEQRQVEQRRYADEENFVRKQSQQLKVIEFNRRISYQFRLSRLFVSLNWKQSSLRKNRDLDHFLMSTHLNSILFLFY